MKIGPREKLILVAVGVLVVIVLLVVLLVIPAFRSLSSLRADVVVSQDAASQAQVLLEQRRAVKDRAANTDVALLQLANAFPENPELPSLIIELQDLAYENDVVVRSVTTQPLLQPATAGYVEMPLELLVWGDWQETVNYLQDLPKLSRFLRVVQFDSSPLPSSEATPAGFELSAPETSIIVKAYIIRPPASGEASPAVPAPAPAPAP